MKTIVLLDGREEELTSIIRELIDAIDQQSFVLNPVYVCSTSTKDLEKLACSLIDQTEKGTLLLLPETLQGLNLLKLLRFNETLCNRENHLQLSSIILYSLRSLDSHLREDPGALLAVSPGTYYVDVLSEDKEAILWILQTMQPMQRSWLDILPKFMVNVPRFPEGHTRHTAASIFGVHILYNFARIIHQNCQKISPENKKVLPLAKRHVLKYPIDLSLHTHISDDWLKEIVFAFRRKMNYFKKVEHELPYLLQLINTIHDQSWRLGGKTAKIGFIDDEAHELQASKQAEAGWFDAFKAALFDHEGILEDVLDKHFSKDFSSLAEEHLDHLVNKIITGSYSCLLLDVHLNKSEEANGIEHKLGTKLLQKLRAKNPAIPVIMITSSNKPWKHRILIELGADAVWVKEGVDENREPKHSYYNLVRLLELIKRVTGPKYQFLRRFYDAIELIKNDNGKLWWNKGKISWPHHGRPHLGYPSKKLKPLMFSQADPVSLKAQVVKLLDKGLHLLRAYLQTTETQFYEASGRETRNDFSWSNPQIKAAAKSIVIQLGKTVELIHGMQSNKSNGVRINAWAIGGSKGKDKTEVIRGDWIAYFLYQHRNECAHFAPDAIYSFQGDENKARSLITFISFLLAYLSSKKQPYYSKDKAELDFINKYKKSHGYRVNPFYLDGKEDSLFNRMEKNPSVHEFVTIYRSLIG